MFISVNVPWCLRWCRLHYVTTVSETLKSGTCNTEIEDIHVKPYEEHPYETEF